MEFAQCQGLIERGEPGTIAAFIAELIMGTGGVLIPPESYATTPALRRLNEQNQLSRPS